MRNLITLLTLLAVPWAPVDGQEIGEYPVKTAFLVDGARSFITLRDGGAGLDRWQLHTGFHLGHYNLEGAPVIHAFPDENGESELVAFTSEQVIRWDLQSGRQTGSFGFAALEVAPVLFGSYQKPELLSDYSAGSNLLAISDGRTVRIIDAFAGKLLHAPTFDADVRAVRWLSSGTRLLVVEKGSNYNKPGKLRIWDMPTGRISEVCEAGFGTSLAAASQGGEFTVFHSDHWRVYDADGRAVTDRQDYTKQVFLQEQKAWYTGVATFAACMPYGGSVFYANGRIGFQQLGFLGGEWSGYWAGDRIFLFWKDHEVAAAHFDGTEFFRQHLDAALPYRLPAGLSLSANGQELLTAGGARIATGTGSITQVISNDDQIFTGDMNGWLRVFGKDGTALDSFKVLATGITHMRSIDRERLFVAGRGRGTVYHIGSRRPLFTMRGHQGGILSSLLSDDGDFLVTAGQDRTIRLWTMQDGALLSERQLSGFPGNIQWGENSTVVIETSSGIREQWDLSGPMERYRDKGRHILLSTAHGDGVEEVSFSADGSHLLSCDGKGVIKIWDPEYLVTLRSVFISESVSGATFSSDGLDIFAHTVNEAYQIDAYSGRLKRTIPIAPFFSGNMLIHSLVPVPGVPQMLVNNNKNGYQFWIHIGTGEMMQLFFADHPAGVYGMAIDSANQVVATYGSDGINLWKLPEAGKKLRHIPYPNESGSNMYVKRKIGFSPEGGKLFFEDDRDMVVYDLEQDKVILKAALCRAMVFLSENVVAYINAEDYSDYTLVADDLVTRERLFHQAVGDINHPVYDMAVHKKTNRLALGRSDGHIELRDARNGTLLQATRATNDRVKAQFNPNTGHIAMTSKRRIHIFDWQQLRKVRTLYFPTRGAVTPNFEFTANGRHLLIDILGGLQIYDPVAYKKIGELDNVGEFETDPTGRYASVQYYTHPATDKVMRDPDSIYVFELNTLKPAYGTKLKTQENAHLWKYVLTPDAPPGILAIKTVYDYRERMRDAQGNYPSKSYLAGFDLSAGGHLKDVELIDPNAFDLQVSDSGRYLFYEAQWQGIRSFDLRAQKNYIFRPSFSEDLYRPAPEEGKIVITDEEGTLYLADPETNSVLRTFSGHTGEISGIDFYEDYMLSASEDGSVNVWDYRTGKLFCSIRILSDDKYIIFSPDGYYMGSPGLGRAIYFQEDGRIYPFDQFDLLYNRPDKVLASLQGDPALQSALKKAYEKRLVRSGFQPGQLADRNSVPQVTIIRPDQELLTKSRDYAFRVEASDASADLRYLHVWVNGVPVYGSRGLEWKERAQQAVRDLTVPLSSGGNTVEVSTVNAAGIESRKEVFRIRYEPEETVAGERTYFLGIGISDYPGKANDLSYAVKDIQDMEAALRAAYPGLISYLLADSLATAERIRSLKDILLQTREDDRVIVSFHGHGLLDDRLDFYFAAYNTDFGNPSNGGLAYTEVEWLLDSIPARRKLVLMDACHSGEVDKESVTYVEGYDPDEEMEEGVEGRSVSAIGRRPKVGIQNSFELMQELFADLSRGNGAVVISAAGGLEYAFEDERWSNGVFTYSVLRGLEDLEADEDGNGQVTVSELKEFVSEEVQRLTKGKQRPTSRQENLEFDFVVW